MEEQLVQKAIEAVTTAAKIAGGEAPKVAAEFLNYMLFCGIFSFLQSLAWGLIVLFIYKLGNEFIKAYKEEYSEAKNNFKEYLALKKRKQLTEEEELLHLNYTSKRDVDSAWAAVTTAKFFTWGICSVLSLFLLINCSEHLKIVGKVLLAPRVVLVESGAHLLGKVKEEVKK